MLNFSMLSRSAECSGAIYPNGNLFIVMLYVVLLSVVMLNVFILGVVMLSVVMLNVIMLNAVAPKKYLTGPLTKNKVL
jgi:hypothetical protein